MCIRDSGVPVEEFIFSDEYCGGIRGGKKLKAVVAGGSSVPILPADLILKTAKGEPRLMSYESLADGGFATGTMLGSGGFIVMDEDTSIVKNLWNFTRFYHCLLYTSDAADERSSVDLGGRRIIKKKNKLQNSIQQTRQINRQKK